jgi:hypothetical protein
MKSTFIAALLLAALPAVASAMCSDKTHAMSCADGMVWDDASKTCTKQVSS